MIKENNIKFQGLKIPAFCMFAISLISRIMGAFFIPVLPEEADKILAALHINEIQSIKTPILQQLFISIGDWIFGATQLVFRLPNIFLGTMIVLFPFFLGSLLKKKEKIWLSIFLMLDPFLLANSIMISGNAATIFFTVIWIWSNLNEKSYLGVFSFIFILASGTGVGYLLILIIFFHFYQATFQKRYWKELFQRILNKFNPESEMIEKCFPIILIIFLFLQIIPVKLSLLFPSLQSFLSVFKNANVYEFPLAAKFLAFISYFPLLIFSFVGLIRFHREKTTQKFRLLVVLSLLYIFFVLIISGNKMYDLVWISIPLAFIAIKSIRNIEIKFSMSEILVISIILIGLLSIFFSLTKLIRQYNLATIPIDFVYQFIFILIIFVTTIFFVIWFFPNIKVKMILKTLSLSLILLFQLINLLRVAGVNNRPNQEIIWGGYSTDLDIFGDLIRQIAENNSQTNPTLSFNGGSSSSLIFHAHSAGYEVHRSKLPGVDQDVVLSPMKEINTEEQTLVQKINSSSYPLWFLRPLSELNLSEYLGWLFWRKADLYHEYNYLNVPIHLALNKESF